MAMFLHAVSIIAGFFLLRGSAISASNICCSENNVTGTSPSGNVSCATAWNMLTADWIVDLNTTFFISGVLLKNPYDNEGYVEVDVGTTSCADFNDTACYIPCSNHNITRNVSAWYVTINVTCDFKNTKGRYIRIRKNDTTALALYDVKVMGWFHVHKGLKNYAFRVPTTQSSTYYQLNSSLAVDGNSYGYLTKPNTTNSCSHTKVTDNSVTHWWQADLMQPVIVAYITIANRLGSCCPDRLANFTVELGLQDPEGAISYTLCRHHDGVAGPRVTLTCTQSIWGQFVRISLTGEALTLCEVEVYSDDDNMIAISPETIYQFSNNLLSASTEHTPSARSSQIVANTEELSRSGQGTTEAEKRTTPMDQEQARTAVEDGRNNSSPVIPAMEEQTNSLQTTAVVTDGTQSLPYSIVADESTIQSTYQHKEQSSAQDIHVCQCPCDDTKGDSRLAEVHSETKQAVKKLQVQHSTLSKQLRRKTSASDKRPSSAAMGLTGITAVSLIFASIVVCDLAGPCRRLFKTRANKAESRPAEI